MRRQDTPVDFDGFSDVITPPQPQLPPPQTNKQKQKKKLLVSELTGHREYAHKQSDVSAPDHDAFASVWAFIVTRTLVLPRGPNAHKQDEDIEDHYSH